MAKGLYCPDCNKPVSSVAALEKHQHTDCVIRMQRLVTEGRLIKG